MSKAPPLVKWIFATIAFVSGSIVAQLLQPAMGKTGGGEESLFVARSEAASPQPSETVVSHVSHRTPTTAGPVVQINAPNVVPSRQPVALEPSGVKKQAVESVSGRQVPAAPAIISTPAPYTPTTTRSVVQQSPERESHHSTEPLVPTETTPPPLPGVAVDAKVHVPKHQVPLRTVVRPPVKVVPPQAVVAQDSKPDSGLSLMSLPSLSAEGTNFQNIRRDLRGQFQPLEGISGEVAGMEDQKPVSRSLTSLSRTTVLPTEIVPATKLKPTAGTTKTDTSVRVARRADKSRQSDRQASSRSPSGTAASTVASSVETSARNTPPTKASPANTSSPNRAAPNALSLKVAEPQIVPSTSVDTVKPAQIDEESAPLSSELMALRSKVRRVLKMYREQEISVREKSAWSVMHSFIGYGVEKKVRIDHQGNRASAIGWICFNNPCRGVRLFYLKNGEIYGRLGPGNQGHEGQFLAMLAQSRVRFDYPMKIEGRDFTVLDLVEREKKSCRPKTELTFKLIGLSHYLDSDESWKNDRGQQWDIPRLIKEEMQQPIIGAACGGTHRLFGLSYAINRRIHKGMPVDGQYRRAKIYLKDYQKYTFKLQNPDGSFSTRFFSGRGAVNDIDRRLLTTGHISEWLAFSLEQEQLTEPRMIQAIDYLADLLLRGKQPGFKVGPLGHALHALNIYDDRVFKQAAKPRTIASHLPEKQL